MVKLKDLLHVIFWAILPISCANNENEVVVEDRWYTSGEIDSMCQTGTIKHYFRSAVDKFGQYKRNLTEEMRVNQILGFVCANVLIRDIQSSEFKSTEIDFPGESPGGIWRRYLNESQRQAARIIRSIVDPSLYNDCADSICRGWPVGSKHAHCDSRTVRVADQLRMGSSLNITEMLQKELPRYLFTVEEFKYINIFINATGNAEFPYISFHRLTATGPSLKMYAAPQLRGPGDKYECANAMCKYGK